MGDGDGQTKRENKNNQVHRASILPQCDSDAISTLKQDGTDSCESYDLNPTPDLHLSQRWCV